MTAPTPSLPYSALLQLLSSASSPDEGRLSAALQSLTPSLLRPFASFPPPSRTAATSPPPPPSLHSDWLALLSSFSGAAGVELSAATSLLQLLLLSSPSASATPSSPSSGPLPAFGSPTFPSLSSLLSFYRQERLASLQVVAALFRCRLDPSHPAHSAAAAFTSRWVREEGEQRLVDCLRSHSHAEAKDEEAADAGVREQLAMLDVLFLCHYDEDDAAPAGLAHGRAQAGAEGGPRASQAERVMRLVSVLHERALMTSQASYLRLSAQGRMVVERLRGLSVLLLVEVLQLGRLRVIVDHPAFALQEEEARARWLQLRLGSPAAADEKAREEEAAAMRRKAERGSEDVQEEVESLLLADSTLLAHMDAALGLPSSPLAHPLLLLAWAVLLSLLLDLHEQLSSLQRLYELPTTSSPSPLLSRSTLVQRLQAAFSFPTSPFALARSFLHELASAGESSSSASGYREIFHELLTAICASSLYPWLTSAVSSPTPLPSASAVDEGQDGGEVLSAPPLTHEEVVSVFALVMGEDVDLAYRWWEAQHVGELEQPLLTEALATFPHSLSLLTLLHATAGHSPQRRSRLRSDGLRDDVLDDHTARLQRDAQICAAQAYRTLLALHTYTAATPPPSLYTSTPQQSAAALAGWTLRATTAVETVDGVVIPAGAYGRPLGGGLVQWRVEWSGWVGLTNRLELLVLRRHCSGGRVDWLQLLSIARLLARLLSNHPALARELQGHVSQQRKAQGGVEISGLACRALLLLASTPSSGVEGGEHEGQLRFGLLQALTQLLRAEAESDLLELTRQLQSAFQAAQPPVAAVPPLSFPRMTSASHTALSLLHTVQVLHSSVERVHGRYPLSLLFLQLLHLWVPHFHLAHLHLNRPPSSPSSFHTAASLPSSASTLTTFASLELPLLCRFAHAELWTACEGWSFATHRERRKLLEACHALFLVTLGHPLSMAAQPVLAATMGEEAALRSSLFALFTRDAAVQRPLLLPLIAATHSRHGRREAGWGAAAAAEADEVDDGLLHSLLTLQQLLRMEKQSGQAAADGRQPLLPHSSLHSAMLMPQASASAAATPPLSSSALLASSDWPTAAPSPQSAVQAVALLVDSTSPSSIQQAAMSVLALLSTPLPLPHARLSLFPCLSPLLSQLRRSLAGILRPRHSPSAPLSAAATTAVFHLLASFVQHQPSVADLLLQPHKDENGDAVEGKEEEKKEQTEPAADGGAEGRGAAAGARPSPLVSAVALCVRQTSSLWSSEPQLLHATFFLLAQAWAHPTLPVVDSLVQPLLRGGQLWGAVRFVLEQTTQPLPRTRTSQPPPASDEAQQRAEAAWRAAAEVEQKEEREEAEGGADGVGARGAADGVEVSASAQLYGHRLAIRASALQLLAVELYHHHTEQPAASSPSSADSSPLPSLASALSGAELRRWLSEWSACDADEGEPHVVKEAAQLRVDVEGLRNPQSGSSEEDEVKGVYLLEVAHRLLYDDLIAVATAPSALLALPSPTPAHWAQRSHPLAEPSISSHLSLRSTAFSPFKLLPPAESGLPSPPSSSFVLELQRSSMSTLLTSLARLNDCAYASARQLRLAESVQLLLHTTLHSAAELLLPPPPSLSPLLLLDALTSSIASARGYSASEVRQAALAGSSGLLLALLYHLLVAQPSSAQKLLASAAVKEQEEQRGRGLLPIQEQLRAVHARMAGLLERVVRALVLACQLGLPQQLSQPLLQQLQHISSRHPRAPMAELLSSLQQPQWQSGEKRLPSASALPLPPSAPLWSALRSLLSAGQLLSRYTLHLQALLTEHSASAQPAHAQRDEVDGVGGGAGMADATSFTSSSRALPRPLSFSSPIQETGLPRSPSSGLTSHMATTQKTALMVGGQVGEDDENATAAGELDLHLSLLAVLCTTASEPLLHADSVARIPLLHQLVQELEEPQSQRRKSPSDPQPRPPLRCVRLLSTATRAVLERLSSLQSGAAVEAESLLRLLEAVADSADGAALLHEEATLQRLTAHTTLRQAILAPVEPTSSSSSFPLPQLLLGEVALWRVVWCRAMSLASLLLLRLPPSASSLQPVLHLVLAYRVRLHWVLHRAQQRRLSVGHLEELSAAVRLTADVGRRMMRQAEEGEPLSAEALQLLVELRAMALTVTEELVHLLLHSRELEERSLAISEDERARGNATASPQPSQASQTAGAAAAHARSVEEQRKGCLLGRASEGEDARGEEKEATSSGDSRPKRLWRPLARGGAAAITAPPAPPSDSPLRSPSRSSPSSNTAALSAASVVSGDGDAGSSGERSRKRVVPSSVLMPGPPALHSASFLLRSPVVQAIAGQQQPWSRPASTAAGAFSAWAAMSAAPPAAVAESALLVPRVEWSLVCILRSALPFLLHCGVSMQGRGGRALLSYRSRMVDVQPIVGGAAGVREREAQLQRKEMERWETEEEYADLLQQDQPYDALGLGDAQHIRNSTPPPSQRTTQQQPTAPASTTSPSATLSSPLSLSPWAPSLLYRPPVSLVVDLTRYCLHLLIRLAALHPLLLQQPQPSQAADAHRPALALAGPAGPSSPSFASLPSMPAVVWLLQALLEQSLLLLVQQAEQHTQQLIQLAQQLSRTAAAHTHTRPVQPQRSAASPAPSPSLASWPFAFVSSLSPSLSSSVPFSSSPPPVSVESAALVALGRVLGVLDGYRERVHVVCEELGRFVAVRSGVQPLQLERRRSTVSPMRSPASAERQQQSTASPQPSTAHSQSAVQLTAISTARERLTRICADAERHTALHQHSTTRT